MKLIEDEEEQMENIIDEFRKKYLMQQFPNLLNQFINKLMYNVYFDEEKISNFKLRLSTPSIIVNEHQHKLVYIISILNWRCSLCEKKYNKEDAKYYCSLCDFNMCDKCRFIRKYEIKKAFPENVKPSNPLVKNPILKYNNHNHILVYCRTSRFDEVYNSWVCNNCRSKFNNEVWSFYCTQCNFDICSKCARFN